MGSTMTPSVWVRVPIGSSELGVKVIVLGGGEGYFHPCFWPGCPSLNASDYGLLGLPCCLISCWARDSKSKFRKSKIRVNKSKFRVIYRNFEIISQNFEIVSRNFELLCRNFD